MRTFLRAGLAVALAITSSGCVVQLISRYDKQTDESAVQLQKDFATFLVGAETAPAGPRRSFSSNQDFYKKASVSIDAMLVRARSIPKNEITVEEINLVRDNLSLLILLNKGCLNAPVLTPVQKEAVRLRGPDLTTDCRSEYGASMDLSSRGDQQLNPVTLPAIKNVFDQQLGAIQALEIAKQRGEGK